MAGIWGFVVGRENLRLRFVIGVVLGGQLVLHLLYGEETFLYSLHFAPLLILVAAFGTTTSARAVVLVLVAGLIVSVGVNNVTRFSEATRYFQNDAVKGRADVLREMMKRPRDPWPRGSGHVVLADPGSAERDKGYHEPGGGFSPGPGSFGVSIWARDRQGNLQTGDEIPLSMLRQSLKTDYAHGTRKTAAISTDTSFYRALWASLEPQRWRLSLWRGWRSDTELSFVVRSVGPAGGPIRTLEWDGQRLRVNDRWTMTVSPPPVAVRLGDEREPDWKTARGTIRRWQGEDGWGYARFELDGHRKWDFSISDTLPGDGRGYRLPVGPRILDLSLPDARFVESINAQVTHLQMSLVGNQTRSADPVNTPVPWQRTGAYIIAALARAGENTTAKELSRYLAENDFYGGFGAEADAPGLAIWSLRQVATHVNDSAYDKWLWQHVRRKAELIMSMLSTTESIRRKPLFPIVPRVALHPDNDLVVEPAREGLIIGRMDYHRPVLYINAVSYRGLVDAAWLADRVGEPALADTWRTRAKQLRMAWAQAFKDPGSNNDRTYITALWPTWIGSSNRRDVIRKNLSERWSGRRDEHGGYRSLPRWTYFELAEAHQWLYLGEMERTWTTLRWFWDHQASPGLYTWWEDDTEGNTYHYWNRIRGWVTPPHVTPHYWTSAEMLLLQLDMLAFVDESEQEPVLVIGAGVPIEWTTETLNVQGIGTSLGTVKWTWRDGRMSVEIRSGSPKKVRVRLGETFPIDAQLRVEYRS
jgi:hypothetical protein